MSYAKNYPSKLGREAFMRKCRNDYCQNLKASDRAECHSCRGKRRRSSKNSSRLSLLISKPRILMLDIETTPDKVYTWGIWNVNIGINQIIEPGGLLCFAAKWYGQDDIMFYSEWKDGTDQMVLEAWKLLDECDVVVHYYGSRFDIPHLNSSFLKQGFPPPAPFKQIDLKLAVGKQFRFSSTKLQFVSQVLGLEGKEEHEGFPLWDKVMNGVGKIKIDAQQRMRSYNERDVFLLEEVYEALLPWIPNHPHRHLYQEDSGCPTCGAEASLMKNAGYAYTKLSKYKQVQCDSCKAFFRSSRRESGVKIQETVL